MKRKKRVPKTPDDVKKLAIPSMDYSIDRMSNEVKVTKQALKSSSVNMYGLKESGRNSCLLTRVSPEQVDRALWIWSELLIRFRSHKIHITSESNASDGIEEIPVDLKEMTSRFEPELSKNPEVNKYQLRARLDPTTSKVFYVDPVCYTPTGILLLRTEEVYGSGLKHEWKETATNRLEERLDEIAQGIHALLKAKHQRALDIKESNRRAEEERRRQYELATQRKYEKGRQKKLTRIAMSFEKSKAIRSFCEELVKDPVDGMDAFIKWALDTADQLDPIQQVRKDIRNGVDPVVPERDDLEEPNRWPYLG